MRRDRRVRRGDKTYSGTPMARSGMGICTKAIRPVSNSPYCKRRRQQCMDSALYVNVRLAYDHVS